MNLGRTGVLTALAAGLLASCATPAARITAAQPYLTAVSTAQEPLTYPYTAVHGRRLAFVAAEHSSDPGSATHRAVRDAFERVRPSAVIIEGFPTELGENPRPIVALARTSDRPEAEPYARGEAGYAARLAVDAGVPFVGGEPSEDDLTDALIAQGFDPVDILLTDVLALLPQSIRGGQITGPDDPAFEDVFRDRVVARAMERNNAPRVNLDDFARWYQAQYGVDYRTDPEFQARPDPGKDTTVGRILRAQSLLRDRHLLALILRKVRERGRVLVVYGGTHRTALAGALNTALGPATVIQAGPPGLTTIGAAP